MGGGGGGGDHPSGLIRKELLPRTRPPGRRSRGFYRPFGDVKELNRAEVSPHGGRAGRPAANSGGDHASIQGRVGASALGEWNTRWGGSCLASLMSPFWWKNVEFLSLVLSGTCLA